MADSGAGVQLAVLSEELNQLEYEFDDADHKLAQHQQRIKGPLYTRRANLISQIPNFWPQVLEQAPPDLDRYISTSDLQVLAACLRSIDVERFDIDRSPRSFSLKFTFSPNKWFEDEVLEKRFHYRRSFDNFLGLVSEPIKIHWKKGKDLSFGLTDAAIEYWSVKEKHGKVVGKVGGFVAMPEQKRLRELSQNSGSASFFTLFSFVSEYRYITADESELSHTAAQACRAQSTSGTNIHIIEMKKKIYFDELEADIYPHGAEIATMIAEDLWPNATKYFKYAQEANDDKYLRLDLENDSDEGSNDVNIRALVKGKSSKLLQ